MMRTPAIAVVTRETRLQGLLARWGTRGAAKFRLAAAHAHELELRATPIAAVPVAAAKRPGTSRPPSPPIGDADFTAYETEDAAYHQSLERIRSELELGFPVTHVGREYIANYDFRACLAVVVVGPDGLVANAAKYVGDVPIIAVNPDPQRIDGVLLPFKAGQVRRAVQRIAQGSAPIREVTLAEATMNDGQRILAFNDLFVGCNGHASARYALTIGGKVESQSSSGMIISTGAGSTGWLSSMFNMVAGFSQGFGGIPADPVRLDWEDTRLAWVVREPFRSKQSDISLVAGLLEEGNEIVIESLMPTRGVIFSDGIESDFLEFNSGSIVRIRCAPRRARLVKSDE